MPMAEETFGGPAPTPRACEESFRHSGWRPGRIRVLEALRASNASAARIRRFRECGSNCYVEYSRSLNRYRFRASYCGDRMCIPCCRARSLVVQERLKQLIGNHRVRLLTFTRKATDRTLADALDDLRTPFFNVRQSLLWRSSVKGGASFIEVKRGRDGVRWHVHLHCLIVGTWIDVKELKALWFNATGDSFVVDVRTGKNRDEFIGYAAAYAGKGWGREMLDDPEGLRECVTALGGRRLFSTFGEWWGRSFDDPADEVSDWRNLGRFHVVYAAAVRGDEWARGVFTSAGCVAGSVKGRPQFFKLDPRPDGTS